MKPKTEKKIAEIRSQIVVDSADVDRYVRHQNRKTDKK